MVASLLKQKHKYKPRFGPDSPTTATLEDDGPTRTAFMGNLLTPLLTQAIIAHLSPNMPAAATVALLKTPPVFAKGKLDLDVSEKV